MYCTWSNIDLAAKTVSVRSKPDMGFRIKDKQERTVPVPDELVKVLAERKKRSSSALVFSAPSGKRNGHLLRKLQKLALRCGLNCGECRTRSKGASKTCENHPCCKQWGLHNFRRTFATMHNEAGVPVTTIQRWFGQSDLATTLRYQALADMRSEKTRAQVNATFAHLLTLPLLQTGRPQHQRCQQRNFPSVEKFSG